MAEQLIAISEEQIADLVRRSARTIVGELRSDLQKQAVPEIMTKQMVADYLQRHPATVNRYMNRKVDPMPFEMGRNGDDPLFRTSDIDKWMKGH